MLILGIESSCDECAASVVRDGKIVLSNEIATQIARHTPFYGVVPELASRLHAQLIQPVVESALEKAGVKSRDLDAVAVTARPGLLGSLLVGVNFARMFAYFLNKPLIGVNHISAHLYACQIEGDVEYPYIGVLVSGGHSIIAKVNSYREMDVLGASVDDAVGEAFDKVAKFYDFGYPGGVAIDGLSKKGDSKAFCFPTPYLNPKNTRKYDMSFSGLKSAAINQKTKFLREGAVDSPENMAASFQRAAVRAVVNKAKAAALDTGVMRVAVGGGVAANSELRSEMKKLEAKGLSVALPSLQFCTDNAVMVAGVGSRYFADGLFDDPETLDASARVMQFKGYWKK